MFKASKTAAAVRLIIAFGAASAAMSNVAFAQEAAKETDEAKKVERIEVTGSRLKRTDMETATPITTVTGDDLKNMGIQDVGQFMQASPIMSGSPAMTTTNNGGNGGTFIELRGLGSSRTLVLVNGRRAISSDFQGIPSSMIERIEVLKDGASATYGADAVAGVVNIITKKNFEGVEVTAMQKAYFDVDTSGQNSFSIVAGKDFGEGNIVFGVDWVKEKAIYQGDVDVDFFQTAYNVGNAAQAKSFVENGPIYTGAGRNVDPGGSSTTPCGRFYVVGKAGSWTNKKCDGGVAAIDDMRAFVASGATNDLYNYNPVNLIQTPYNKLNMFVEGKFQLNDTTSLYTETRLNKRTSLQELAPTPYDTGVDPGFKVTRTVGGASVTSNGVSGQNYYNPFGADVYRSRRRMVEAPRTFEQDITRFQQVVGVTGDIKAIDGWTYDVSANFGADHETDTDFGQLFGPNLANALGPSFKAADGKVYCGTPGAIIDGCVSMNVFGGPGSITKEMLDYVSAPLLDTSVYNQLQVTAFAGGDVFELPGGMATGGFGVEYLKENVKNQTDSGKFLGQVSGNKGKVTQSAEKAIKSVFSEWLFPLVSDQEFAKRVELKAGVRHDQIDYAGSANTYQLGATWEVIDGLLLRSNYGTVFRSPTLTDLFGPSNDGFPSAIDPCNADAWSGDPDNDVPPLSTEVKNRCLAAGVPNGGSQNFDTQQLGKFFGNSKLKPETGDTFTAGFAYSPEFIDGLGLTVDFWRINIEDVIDSVGVGDSLDGCYNGGIASLCKNIVRDAAGEISYVNSQVENFSKKVAEGIDTEVTYSVDSGFGRFNFNTVWTHFTSRQDYKYNGEDKSFALRELKGEFVDDTSYAKDKISFTTSWDLDDLNVTYRLGYIGKMKYNAKNFTFADDTFPDMWAEVDSMVYHDISAQYNFPTGTVVSVGVENVTDEEPPYIENAFNASTDESNYRLFGRGYFVKLSQKF